MWRLKCEAQLPSRVNAHADLTRRRWRRSLWPRWRCRSACPSASTASSSRRPSLTRKTAARERVWRAIVLPDLSRLCVQTFVPPCSNQSAVCPTGSRQYE